VWPHASPKFTENQALLDEVEIAPDLFYTSSGDEAVSSLKMSCRMAHNIAGKIHHNLWYSKWNEIMTGVLEETISIWAVGIVRRVSALEFLLSPP